MQVGQTTKRSGLASFNCASTTAWTLGSVKSDPCLISYDSASLPLALASTANLGGEKSSDMHLSLPESVGATTKEQTHWSLPQQLSHMSVRCPEATWPPELVVLSHNFQIWRHSPRTWTWQDHGPWIRSALTVDGVYWLRSMFCRSHYPPHQIQEMKGTPRSTPHARTRHPVVQSPAAPTKVGSGSSISTTLSSPV